MKKTQPFESLPHDANKVLNNVADEAVRQVRELPNRVDDTISTATNAIAAASANATEALKGAAASTDDLVRDNPWIAIGVTAGIAGAVGFFAGLMAAPKRRFWS